LYRCSLRYNAMSLQSSLKLDASFSRAKLGGVPQAIAHRGFKGLFPENTMAAFNAAIEAGADALEADVHLSCDNQIVMCHDPNLLRCFNIKKQVSDMNYYGEIDKLLTIKEPKDKMPLLKDVLELVHTKGQWLLIDIKMDNPIRIIHEIANVLRKVDDNLDYWKSRILLGIWHEKFLDACQSELFMIPITHISLSATYTRSKFLYNSQVQSLNMYLPSLYNEDPLIKEAQAMGKSILVWTVNDEDWMHLALDLGVDGVISDYPNKTMKVTHEKSGSFHWSLRKMAMMWSGKILGRIVMAWRIWKWST